VSKKIIIIAGPNGAGKTTFARSFLPEEAQCPRFINADLIAAGLSPFAPEVADLARIRQWRAQGYHVSLFFLSLPDAEAAVARVAERVRQGGHHIPEDVIRRRFAAGRRNFERAYKLAVDAWAKYDNMGESPTLLEWGENE
jgi:predicted ABC-type ATPase